MVCRLRTGFCDIKQPLPEGSPRSRHESLWTVVILLWNELDPTPFRRTWKRSTRVSRSIGSLASRIRCLESELEVPGKHVSNSRKKNEKRVFVKWRMQNFQRTNDLQKSSRRIKRYEVHSGPAQGQLSLSLSRWTSSLSLINKLATSTQIEAVVNHPKTRRWKLVKDTTNSSKAEWIYEFNVGRQLTSTSFSRCQFYRLKPSLRKAPKMLLDESWFEEQVFFIKKMEAEVHVQLFSASLPVC